MPKLLQIAAFVFIILYILSPWDLLPDYLGILGRFDDIAVAAYIMWRIRRWKQISGKATSQQESKSSSSSKSKAQSSTSHSAHDVLGVKPSASKAEIEKAYKKLAAQYHPDKVTHLGKEFQELAHEKMVEIQRAYEQLRG